MAVQEYIVSITTQKVVQKLSFFKTKHCHLIFTNFRIIVAYYDPEKAMDDYRKKLTNSINRDSSSNVYFNVNLRFQSFSNFYQRYVSMPPEDILKEHPDNFSITASSIRNLVFSKGYCCKDENGLEENTPDKLCITLKNNNQKSFYLQTCFFHELCDALRHIVPNAEYNKDRFQYIR
jgi:hypothetical protein